MQILVPLHLGAQILLITVAILTTHVCIRTWPAHGLIYSLAVVISISALFHLLIPRLLDSE